MDQNDIILMNLLLLNSRSSYAELAEKLNLSVNAVHKRIQLLIETGVIRRFTAKLGGSATPLVIVLIWGPSRLASFQGLPEKLAAQGEIYWLTIGGGKVLYIGAYLRSVNDLAPLVNYVKENADISEPVVGIMALAPMTVGSRPSENVLCGLDYRIIRSLQNDARKPLMNVAEELGVSTKTVRRRLDRMIRNSLIELSVEWYPDKSNDICTIVELRFKPGADSRMAYGFSKKYFPHVLFLWTYANIPDLAMLAFWTNSMSEVQSMRESLEKEVGVASVNMNILYVGYIFKTWRDQIPVE